MSPGNKAPEPFAKLGPALQQIAGGAAASVLSVVEPFLEVDESAPEGSPVVRLAVEETLADVALSLSEGHPELVSEILSRLHADKAMVRIRAVAAARSAVTAAILTASGFIAQAISGGLSRQVSAPLVALKGLADGWAETEKQATDSGEGA